MAQTFTKPTLTSSVNAYSSTATTINGTARPRLVAPLIESLDFMSVPLQKLIAKGKSIDNPKYEWSDERFNAITATGDAASYNNSVTTINFAAGHGARVQQYATLRNQLTGEIVWVSAMSTDAATVTRAFGGTTAASVAANQVWDILAPAVPQHVDSPAATMTRGELYFNYIQQMDRAISIADIQNNTNNAYLIKGKEGTYEKMKQMKEAFRDLERALIMGGKQAESASLPYALGGIYSFTTTNSTDNAAAAALTETQVLTQMQAVWSDVGPEEMGDTIMSNIFMKQVFSSWVDSMRRAGPQDTKYKFKMEQWENDLGTFNFLPHYHNPSTDIVCFNPRSFQILPYQNMDWHEEDLARTGLYQNSHVYGVFTLEAKADRTRWKIINSLTTRASYGSLPTL